MSKKVVVALGVVGLVGGSTYLILQNKEKIKAFFESANRDLTTQEASGGSSVNQVGVDETEVKNQVDQEKIINDFDQGSILESGSSNENVLSTISFGDAKISYDYSKATPNKSSSSSVKSVNVPVSIDAPSGKSSGHAVVPKSILGKKTSDIKASPKVTFSKPKSNFGSKIKNTIRKVSKVAKIGNGNSMFSKIKSIIKKEK